MNTMGDLRWTRTGTIGNARNGLHIFMKKMCFRHNKTYFLRLVGYTRKIKYALAQPLQNLCPFARLERNTVCPVEAGGYKAQSMAG